MQAVEAANALGNGIHGFYFPGACGGCALKSKCTTGKERRVRRWEHEAVLEQLQARLDRRPQQMTVRRRTIEHVFRTLKHWMGSTHFLTRGLENVKPCGRPSACVGARR